MARKTIGLFMSILENEFSASLLEGASKAANDLDVNLIVFPLDMINAVYNNPDMTACRYQYNILSSYMNSDGLDGIMIDFAAVTQFISKSEKEEFLKSASFNERNKRLGWRWARGLILNLSIGQGQIVTPLQQAVLVGSLATNKGVYRPHFMKELRDSEGNVVKTFEPEIIRSGKMKPETHRILMAAMDSVANHPGGTGKRGAIPGIRVGAKTGSGEWKKGEKTHAWYAVVAPIDNPEIAVAVIMEAAGGGGAVSGPIARKVLMAYFGLEDRKK